MMAQFPAVMNGGPNMWAITSEERTKHDKQFDSLRPAGGHITGDQARGFFLQSGLPAPVLAEIWALSDLNKDGKMDQQEFSIAMKLIKLTLQGQRLPPSLPSVMKQPPVFSPLTSARFGSWGCRWLHFPSDLPVSVDLSLAWLEGALGTIWPAAGRVGVRIRQPAGGKVVPSPVVSFLTDLCSQIAALTPAFSLKGLPEKKQGQ